MTTIISHKLMILKFLWLSSKLKGVSYHAKSISVQSIYIQPSGQRNEHSGFLIQIHRFCWLNDMNLLQLLYRRGLQYRLYTIMLIYLKCLSFFVNLRIHKSFRVTWIHLSHVKWTPDKYSCHGNQQPKYP